MPKYQLILVLALWSLSSAAFAKRAPTSAMDLTDFIPAGFYRKLSGPEDKCPQGRFQWIEDGRTLAIGAGRPVLFHTFNSQETRVISQSPKCVAQTKNQIINSSRTKAPRRTIAQTVSNDCAGAKNTSQYTLEVSKVHNKRVVELTIQVSRLAPQKKQEPAVRCSYEAGPF